MNLSESMVSLPVQITSPQLPLAMYREIQAHLQQLTGVTVTLLPPTPGPFDYQASQVGGIEITTPAEFSQSEANRLQEILTYYAQQFGAWKPYGEAQ